MRHDAWRHDAASYPLRGEILPRYTDVDVWQHLNNTALITMQGEAVQQALRSVFGDAAWRSTRPALACVENATDFLAEAHYPAPLTWGARVLGVDATGLRVATALFQHGQCVGLHGSTLAWWTDGHAAGPGAEPAAALRAAQVPGADTLPSSAPRDAAPGHGADAGERAGADPAGAGPHAAAAPALAQYPWRPSFGLRFGDSDAHRLVSDTCLARAAEQMRVEFLHQVFEGRQQLLGGMLVAHVSLRWLRRGASAAQWQLGSGVAHVGERSLAMRGAMFQDGQCVAQCESVMVAIDRTTRRSARLSDEARAVLEPYRMHGVPASDRR
ncbi:MAG TPA: acyl-[acyl-carrier-protein] thioesterase [Quisquiliibacterium sp.]|nr:acyl-[acyl-carrier-protein] thioesterase [Quisquiliibacterium sp.]